MPPIATSAEQPRSLDREIARSPRKPASASLWVLFWVALRPRGDSAGIVGRCLRVAGEGPCQSGSRRLTLRVKVLGSLGILRADSHFATFGEISAFARRAASQCDSAAGPGTFKGGWPPDRRVQNGLLETSRGTPRADAAGGFRCLGPGRALRAPGGGFVFGPRAGPQPKIGPIGRLGGWHRSTYIGSPAQPLVRCHGKCLSGRRAGRWISIDVASQVRRLAAATAPVAG